MSAHDPELSLCLVQPLSKICLCTATGSSTVQVHPRLPLREVRQWFRAASLQCDDITQLQANTMTQVFQYTTLPLGSLLLKLMIRPDAMPAMAKEPAVTMAMFAPGLTCTSLSDPARYDLGCSSPRSTQCRLHQHRQSELGHMPA